MAGIPLTVSGEGPRLSFNFLFTGSAFVTLLILGGVYRLGLKSTAIWGFTVTSLLLLLPNDNCHNPFNDTWTHWIGASPMMFLPASLGVAVGVCGLLGFIPKGSVATVYGIAGLTFLLGMSHLFRVVW